MGEDLFLFREGQPLQKFFQRSKGEEMKLLSLGEKFIPEAVKPMLTSIGLLFLRVFLGAFMMFSHGWGKMMKFGVLSAKFPDPIGLGSSVALSMAIFAEVFCSLLLIVGLFTRLAAMPLLVTMLVAAFVIHGADPWGKKEFALLYAVPFLTLIFTGAGRYSLDGWFNNKQ
ncbi:MAG: DoxX family protein [Caldilineaceae bacterium]|nr:DoxX family protein [Caldilineaceae bacterium]